MALLAGSTVVMLARSLMPGLHERRMAVAAAAAASARCEHTLARRRQIEQLHASVVVENHGADRPFQYCVRAGLPGAVRPFAMAAAVGAKFAIVTVAQQRVVVGVRFEVDVPAIAAVAAGRAAARDVLLPAKRDAAVTAIATLYRNFGFVNKHGTPNPRGYTNRAYAAIGEWSKRWLAPGIGRRLMPTVRANTSRIPAWHANETVSLQRPGASSRRARRHLPS